MSADLMRLLISIGKARVDDHIKAKATYLLQDAKQKGNLEAIMKFGFRKPSLRKRISARTSIKRQVVHRAAIKMPRGYGWIRNPKKYVYNKDYNRTSFDIFRFLKKLFK